MTKDSQGIISIKNKAIDKTSLNPDYVRLNHYEGGGPFRNWDQIKSRFRPQVMPNPEGSIPLKFVNMFVQQQPYQMLQK